MRKISRPVVKAQSGRRRHVENVSGRRRPVEKRQDGLWSTVDAVDVRLKFSSRPLTGSFPMKNSPSRENCDSRAW